MTIHKPLPPCPLCESEQVMLCEDANNPHKSFARCRSCRCEAPLSAWCDIGRNPGLAYLLGAVSPLCAVLGHLPPDAVPAIVYKDAAGMEVRVEYRTLERIVDAWKSLLPVAVPMFHGVPPERAAQAIDALRNYISDDDIATGLQAQAAANAVQHASTLDELAEVAQRYGLASGPDKGA
jgi:hypothetical protein